LPRTFVSARWKGELVRKLGLLICIGLLVMVMGTVLGCGSSGGGSTASPKEVTKQYMDASLNFDVDTAYELLSSQDKQSLTKEDMQAEIENISLEGLDFSYVIGEETINGDEASVDVTMTVTDTTTGESDEFTNTLQLVKENGEWKVYFGDSTQ
jgi:hypothetical protein